VKSFERRKMYWARNYVSWPLFSSFKPNKSHSILAEWEKKKKIHHQVTQNVDSLLTKAGCLKVTELHGSSYQVKCLECDFRLSREAMQV
jgi:NAD-dependent deacetylase sirtuin 4